MKWILGSNHFINKKAQIPSLHKMGSMPTFLYSMDWADGTYLIYMTK